MYLAVSQDVTVFIYYGVLTCIHTCCGVHAFLDLVVYKHNAGCCVSGSFTRCDGIYLLRCTHMYTYMLWGAFLDLVVYKHNAGCCVSGSFTRCDGIYLLRCTHMYTYMLWGAFLDLVYKHNAGYRMLYIYVPTTYMYQFY